MNEIAKTNGSTLPVIQEAQAIAKAAQENAGFEKMLKFKKGTYECDGQIVPLGTQYVAHCIGWTMTWIKFEDQKPVEGSRKRYRVGDGRRVPQRDELGDLDMSKWPPGLSGPHSDPWSFQFELPMEDKNGDLVVFVTSSWGGKRAVSDLCKSYSQRVQRSGVSQQPVVKLAGTVFTSDRFGDVQRPLFEIIGWAGEEKEGVRDFKGPDAPMPVQEEMNDKIPF